MVSFSQMCTNFAPSLKFHVFLSGMVEKLLSLLVAASPASQNFFASPNAFFDHAPVVTKSAFSFPVGHKFNAFDANIVDAPPCTKITL